MDVEIVRIEFKGTDGHGLLTGGDRDVPCRKGQVSPVEPVDIIAAPGVLVQCLDSVHVGG